MESNGAKIAAIVVAALLIIGGIFWVMNNDSDSEDTSNNNQSSQQETQEQAQTQQNIVELAAATPELSTLVTAVQAAGLVDTLSGPGPFTVFAPTNDAFAALPEGTLDTLLLPENVADLTSVLTYHVVAAEAFSTDLSDGQVIETVNGESLTVSIRDGGVFINDAQVIIPDVDASNGVVHVIDTVLIP